MTTAERIKAALERKKMSAAALARELEISKSTVSDWVNGVHEPNLESLRQMADALECKVHTLIGDKAS